MLRWLTFFLLYGLSAYALSGSMPVGSAITTQKLHVDLSPAIRATKYPKIGQKKSCAFCSNKKKCGTLESTGKQLSHCKGVKGIFQELVRRDKLVDGKRRNGYPDAALFMCWKRYCKGFKVSEYCGLQPGGKLPKRSYLQKLMRQLDSANKALTVRFKKEAAPRFKYRDYIKRREEVIKLQSEAKKYLDVALDARKRNFELKKKLKSLKFRKILFDINKYGNETMYYKNTLLYWSWLNQTVNKAVRTSALQVQQVLRDIKSDVTEFAKEAKLARLLTKSVGDFDTRYQALYQEELNLQDRVERIKVEIKRIEKDTVLFRKVGSAISNLLKTLTRKISNGDVKVDCGDDALALAIAEFTT